MAAREESLRNLLQSVGCVTQGRVPKVDRTDMAASKYAPEIRRVYRKLGGRLADLPFRHTKGWDLEFDGIAVELDEELHFNAYRLITLRSSLYRMLPGFPHELYRESSRAFAGHCLRAGLYGGKWSNKSCARQFGAPAAAACLTGGGAPRWKQRAFYDFVKDVSSLWSGSPVVRISIWDTVRDGSTNRRVDEILRTPTPNSARAIAKLIRKRAARRKSVSF